MSKKKPTEGENPRLKTLRDEISELSDQLNEERTGVAHKAATSLAPLVTEYVQLSDQSTHESVHDLCDFIRGLCKRHDLAVTCPKTGVATQVYSTPRADQNYKPRVSFHVGSRPTSHSDRLNSIDFVVQPERSTSFTSASTDRPKGGRRDR